MQKPVSFFALLSAFTPRSFSLRRARTHTGGRGETRNSHGLAPHPFSDRRGRHLCPRRHRRRQ